MSSAPPATAYSLAVYLARCDNFLSRRLLAPRSAPSSPCPAHKQTWADNSCTQLTSLYLLSQSLMCCRGPSHLTSFSGQAAERFYPHIVVSQAMETPNVLYMIRNSHNVNSGVCHANRNPGDQKLLNPISRFLRDPIFFITFDQMFGVFFVFCLFRTFC